ncbi:alpha-tocopherol transfer protein-like [Tropilaelaps mercedesae]|uniref:Alpha-tocopherol transfer protein-like n=1 Tax=Tropilaelaps mercedesae TaxID=418985 RepID=A0A1V9XS19_9ACAR|nr:alpha-tocopherol transfer protein-like [Tropilaelaps mercedesae]
MSEKATTNINDLSQWKLDFTAKVPFKDPVRYENALNDLKKRLTKEIGGWEQVLDDKHLLKFLRYKDCDSVAAFKMLRAAQEFRLADPKRHFPEGKGPLDYAYVYNLRCVEVLRYRNPRDGSAVAILRLGDWRPETGVDFFEAQNAGVFLADCVLDDERVQRDGVTLIIDCQGVSMSMVMSFLPPSSIPSTICSIQDTCPIRFVGIHLLNQPLMYQVVYGLAWPFISKENQQKIHLHGSNIEALHKYVDPAILPRDLLGPHEPDCLWLPEIVYRMHNDFVRRSVLLGSS